MSFSPCPAHGLRSVLLTTLLALSLVLSVPGQQTAAAAAAVEPTWGPAEEVPPAGEPHEGAATAVYPDGTLVAAWLLREEAGPGDVPPLTTSILRSTKPPQESWTHAVTLPVANPSGLSAIAPRADGGLEISYTLGPGSGTERPHQVRTWHADGSVGEVALEHGGSSFDLAADAEGDVVATRLGPYNPTTGFKRVVRHLGDAGWQRLPTLAANPRDVYLPGPGDSVWMAGFAEDRSRLEIRRWTPQRPVWSSQWRRALAPRGLRKPLVQGFDLALGGAGSVVLAWQQRARGDNGATVRSVRRESRSGWARPMLLDQLPAEEPRPLSAPVVAAAGEHAVVAWSTPSSSGLRSVRAAWLADGGRDLRSFAATGSFRGARDLSLDVDVRADGDLLFSYLQRRGHRRQVMAWTGTWLQIRPALLLKDAGVMLRDSAYLVPGLASVVAVTGDGGLVSFTQQR